MHLNLLNAAKHFDALGVVSIFESLSSPITSMKCSPYCFFPTYGCRIIIRSLSHSPSATPLTKESNGNKIWYEIELRFKGIGCQHLSIIASQALNFGTENISPTTQEKEKAFYLCQTF